MRKHRKLLITLACLAALAAIVGLLTRERQPHCQGLPLSEWVDILGGTAREHGPHEIPLWQQQQDAAGAIRRIGTNALPLLLKWIHHEPTPWRNNLADALSKLPGVKAPDPLLDWIRNTQSDARATGVIYAFFALGSTAASGVPELGRLASDPASPKTAERCLEVLPFVGTNGLEELLAIVQTKNYPYRWQAIEAIGSMGMTNRDATPAIPFLIRSLDDTDPNVAGWAAEALGELRLEPERTVPALTETLQSSNQRLRLVSALALGHFGPRAESALPQLTKALDDPDRRVRSGATNAFNVISASLLTNAPPR